MKIFTKVFWRAGKVTIVHLNVKDVELVRKVVFDNKIEIFVAAAAIIGRGLRFAQCCHKISVVCQPLQLTTLKPCLQVEPSLEATRVMPSWTKRLPAFLIFEP